MTTKHQLEQLSYKQLINLNYLRASASNFFKQLINLNYLRASASIFFKQLINLRFLMGIRAPSATDVLGRLGGVAHQTLRKRDGPTVLGTNL